MKKKVTIAAILLLLIIFVLFFVLRGKEDQVIIDTSYAEPAHIVAVLRQTGVIKPQVGAMLEVGARTTGILEMLDVKVGDSVKEKQLLARIDSRSILQNISQANDLLQKAEIELKREKTIFPVKKAMQENAVESSRSNYEYLKGLYDREKVLYEKGYSRQETLEKSHHDMISAETDYRRQKLQLELMQSEYNSDITSLTYEVNRQKSFLEEQNINLTYTEIIAPIDGIVSAVNSVEGETIVAGLEVAKLITIFRPELLEMHIYVDESDIGKIATGMKVIYNVDTYQDREFSGVISRVNLQSEVKDGVTYYIAIVDISKDDSLLLRPEMTANVQIVWQEKDALVTVPSNAIKWEDGQRVVYKVANKGSNESVAIPVLVGLRGIERIEIVEGLADGDEVVTKFGTKEELKATKDRQ